MVEPDERATPEAEPSPTTPPPDEEPPSIMAAFAWLMILGGAVVVGGAFLYDVSVDSGPSGIYGLSSKVANIDRIAVRHMLLNCGLVAYASGWIALAVHYLRQITQRPVSDR